MQKKKTLKIGPYLAEIFPEKTKNAYGLLSEDESDVARMFRAFLSGAARESLVFLEELGVDPKKISTVRPVSRPDENGEVLFFAAARLFGSLLEGGDVFPRQSAEIAGISVILVGDENAFQTKALGENEQEMELRFVIPLPFDSGFFEQKE